MSVIEPRTGLWRVRDRVRLILIADAVDEAAQRLASDLKGLDVEICPLSGPDERVIHALSDLLAADKDGGCDTLLVSHTISVDVATVGELRRVAATDPMIACVSPRFDRDSLYAFPRGLGERDIAASDAAALLRHLPAVTYVPLPDHRCLYLKGELVSEFGLRQNLETLAATLDDFALRLNRLGFRTALANHARVAHRDFGRGTAVPDRSRWLEREHPGYRKHLSAYLASSKFQAEHILSGLVPNSSGGLDIAFDFTSFGTHHAGTSALARELVKAWAPRWTDAFAIHAICSQKVYDVHLRSLPHPISRVDPDDPRSFAALIRIGQPATWDEVERAVARAPALVFFLLDTIALDSLSAATEDLESVLRFTLQSADGVLFNSDFTRRQYGARFPIPGTLIQRTSLHALDPAAYRAGPIPATQEAGAVLVVGNAHPHKFVPETVDAIARSCPQEKIVALGLPRSDRPNVVCYPSGALEQEAVERLYAGARLIVYPSLYEGFGFPLLHAIAHRKPVLARPLDPFLEIAAAVPEARNIHFYRNEAELVRLIQSDMRWSDDHEASAAPRTWAPPIRAPRTWAPRTWAPRTWADCCSDLHEVVTAALERVSTIRIVDRIEFIRGHVKQPLGYLRRESASEAAAAGHASEVDKAAVFVGHLAQEMMRRLGRTRRGYEFTRLLWRLARTRRR